MAETLEGAESVDTLSVPAHLALEGAALIYVCRVEREEICVFPGIRASVKAGVNIIFFVKPPDTLLNTI